MGRGAVRLIVSAAGICACLSAAHGQTTDDRFSSGFFLPDNFSLFSAAAVTSEPNGLRPDVPMPRPAPWRASFSVASADASVPVADQALGYAPAEPQTSGDDRFSFLWLGARPERDEVSELDSLLLARRPSVLANSKLGKTLAGDAAARMAARAPLQPIGSDIASLIAAKAQEHGVPIGLADAVVRVESNYQPRVSGKGGALGLMQIKYSTAKAIGFTGTAQDLFDPATNLEWGMRYLAGAHKLANGDTCGTVMRYQGGHRTTQMSKDATVYCGKVKSILARTGHAPVHAKADAKSEPRAKTTSERSKVAAAEHSAAKKTTRSASAMPLLLTSR